MTRPVGALANIARAVEAFAVRCARPRWGGDDVFCRKQIAVCASEQTLAIAGTTVSAYRMLKPPDRRNTMPLITLVVTLADRLAELANEGSATEMAHFK